MVEENKSERTNSSQERVNYGYFHILLVYSIKSFFLKKHSKLICSKWKKDFSAKGNMTASQLIFYSKLTLEIYE